MCIYSCTPTAPLVNILSCPQPRSPYLSDLLPHTPGPLRSSSCMHLSVPSACLTTATLGSRAFSGSARPFCDSLPPQLRNTLIWRFQIPTQNTYNKLRFLSTRRTHAAIQYNQEWIAWVAWTSTWEILKKGVWWGAVKTGPRYRALTQTHRHTQWQTHVKRRKHNCHVRLIFIQILHLCWLCILAKSEDKADNTFTRAQTINQNSDVFKWSSLVTCRMIKTVSMRVD